MLTSAMVFGSVGCNKQNNAKTDEKGRPTITFQTIDFEGSPLSGDHADEVVAKMEDYTNTHVEFTWVAMMFSQRRFHLLLQILPQCL